MHRKQLDYTAVLQGVCDRADLTARLHDYITDPLADPGAKEIEDHLLECRDCREFFLLMVDVRGEARRAEGAHGNGDARNAAKVVRMARYRKEVP